MILLLLVGCSSAKTESKEFETSNKKAVSVIDKLDNFPVSLNTFVKDYNSNTSLQLKNPSEVDFQVFNENQGYSKTLIQESSGNVQYNLDAIFDNDKNFKRIIYNATMPDKGDQDAISVLTATLFSLGIDVGFLNDFIESGEADSEFNNNGYKVYFLFEKSIGFLNATVDKE